MTNIMDILSDYRTASSNHINKTCDTLLSAVDMFVNFYNQYGNYLSDEQERELRSTFYPCPQGKAGFRGDSICYNCKYWRLEEKGAFSWLKCCLGEDDHD